MFCLRGKICLRKPRNAGIFSGDRTLPESSRCVAGAGGFEPPYGGTKSAALPLRTSPRATLGRAFNPGALCVQAHLERLDFVSERSIALHIASVIIDAAPEPRRLQAIAGSCWWQRMLLMKLKEPKMAKLTDTQLIVLSKAA